MDLFDVNILIYAHREDQEHHAFYRGYIETHVNGSDGFALSPIVAAAFIRIVTNPRFPNGPTPQPQALSVIDSFARLDHCYWTSPSQRHWQIFANLCRACHCAGKNVADAQNAAVAIEHACRWVTRDRDFRAFERHGLILKILEP